MSHDVSEEVPRCEQVWARARTQPELDFNQVSRFGRRGLSHACRHEVWKVFIGEYTLVPSQWPAQDAASLSSYEGMLASVCRFSDPERRRPIAINEVQRAIEMDVPRTMPTLPFYAPAADGGLSPPQLAVQRIMFVVTAVNASVNYSQATNDIAAQVLYAFCGGDRARLTPLVEAGAFHSFQTIFSYLSEGHGSEVGVAEFAELAVRQMTALLRLRDPQLARHLEACGAYSSLYALRWMQLLFLREFRGESSLRLWDYFLSFGMYFSKVAVFFGVALCVSMRAQLLAITDLTEIVDLLLHPTVQVEDVIALTTHSLVPPMSIAILQELIEVPESEWGLLRRKYGLQASEEPSLTDRLSDWLGAFVPPPQ